MSDSPSGAEIKFGHGGARAGAGRKPNPEQTPPPVPDVERWYCVYTGHGLQQFAELEMRRAGFVVFAPLVWKAAIRPRRDTRGIVRPGKPDRLVSAFPRYSFVRLRLASPDWVRILGLPGVDYIVGHTPKTPPSAADEIVELIRGLCGPSGVIYGGGPAGASEPPTALAAGTAVKLLTGPFAGLSGICTLSDGERVRVLLEIMGRQATVAMQRDAVRAS